MAHRLSSVHVDRTKGPMNTTLMDAVEAESSRTGKEKLLVDADDRTRRGIKYATDTFITFGATMSQAAMLMVEQDAEMSAMDARLFGAAEVKKSPIQTSRSSAWWDAGFAMMDQLAARGLTGNAAQTAIHKWIGDVPSLPDAKWGLRVLNKDLRCGVSQKTVVKIWPGLIEPFSVALAQPYDDQELGPGYVEPKLDGLRMLIIDGVAYTRNGHVLGGMEHVIDQLGDLAHKWVWDGECLDPNVSFEETSGALRKHGGNKRTQIFHAFDVVDRGDWVKRDTPDTDQRKRDLAALAAQVVPRGESIVPIYGTKYENATPAQMIEARDRYLSQGLEGAMFKLAESPYLFKRSSSVLKFKRFDTMDVEIVDVVEGSGKYTGVLGAIVVEINGVRFNCGSGYTDTERANMWALREQLIGKTAEVKYQNKTAKGKARFPTFVRIRTDL